MIYQGRSSRRPSQVAKSQLALRLGLAIYAALCATIALRTIVLVFRFPDTVWTVQTILSLSAPIVLPLSFLPGGERAVIGSATLADVTAALLLMALPLPLAGRRGRG
ncbi:MAG: hypothetical protein IT338_13460 [Thermomicrobiales bacterium]|nr:hypothetical protein [Thermomicrobiales bacterium]